MHPDLLGGDPERFGIGLQRPGDALDLVPYREPVAVPTRNGRGHFHRIVVVAGDGVLQVRHDGGAAERLVGVATRVVAHPLGLPGSMATSGASMSVDWRCAGGIAHVDKTEAPCVAASTVVATHHGHRLAEGGDLSCVERKRDAGEVGDHPQHVGDPLAAAESMRSTVPRAMVLHDKCGVDEVGHRVVGGVACLPRDLEPAVDAGHRLTGQQGCRHRPRHGRPATVASWRSHGSLDQLDFEPVLRQRLSAVGGARGGTRATARRWVGDR